MSGRAALLLDAETPFSAATKSSNVNRAPTGCRAMPVKHLSEFAVQEFLQFGFSFFPCQIGFKLVVFQLLTLFLYFHIQE